MAWEILDSFRIQLRTYNTEQDLLNRVKSLFVNIICKQQET